MARGRHVQKLWSEPKYLLTRTASGVIWTGYLQSPVNLCNNVLYMEESK